MVFQVTPSDMHWSWEHIGIFVIGVLATTFVHQGASFISKKFWKKADEEITDFKKFKEWQKTQHKTTDA